MKYLSMLAYFTPAAVLFRLLLAAILGGAIGWERGRHGHIAGLRTHILVCIGAATAMMVGMFCFYELGTGGDITRIGAQVISGIGFLGVGTIMVRDRNLSQVTGVTTAAGLWATAAIGLATGAGFYWGALSCCAVAMLTMTVLAIMEKQQKESLAYTRLYTELKSPVDATLVEERIRQFGIYFENFIACPPHSGTIGHLGLEMTVFVHDRTAVLQLLSEMDCVYFTVTSE